jgi:predicted O-methyltransferase YrrM
MQVLQIPSELDRMMTLARDRKPRRILEIGCWDGGTLREWLSLQPAVVVAVDPAHRNAGSYAEWTDSGTELVLGFGLSQSAEMVGLMGEHAPYDWAFIDGDHGYPAVRADVANVLPLMADGGAVLLHDITPEDGEDSTGPGEVFAELAASGYTTGEIVSDPFTSSAGIGIVYL